MSLSSSATGIRLNEAPDHVKVEIVQSLIFRSLRFENLNKNFERLYSLKSSESPHLASKNFSFKRSELNSDCKNFDLNEITKAYLPGDIVFIRKEMPLLLFANRMLGIARKTVLVKDFSRKVFVIL